MDLLGCPREGGTYGIDDLITLLDLLSLLFILFFEILDFFIDLRVGRNSHFIPFQSSDAAARPIASYM